MDVPTTDPAAGLHAIDWVILFGYAVGTLLLGWAIGRRQHTTQEYFRGSGRMPPWLVGVSLFATLLSTISYRSMPGEALAKGPVLLLFSLIALPVAYLVVGYVLLPVYMRHRVTSAYQLLENKLGLSVRLLGASMFLVLRLVWMSLLVYLTAQAMAIMMGVSQDWIPLIVLITGLVAVSYTSLGGLRAVVVTDLLQTILLYGGALLVIGTVTYNMGGFGWFPTTWPDHWDSQPLLPTSPATRVSVLGTLLMIVTWYIATAGGDQTSVQRFMATSDAAAARRSYATQLTVGVIVTLTLALVGLALLGYFQTHPEQLPRGMSIQTHADDLFPHFIAFHLPPGVSGLVVAALFAAAMSSIDSGVNSITAVVQTDFLDRLGSGHQTEKSKFRNARLLAFAIGAIVVIGSSRIGSVPGNISAVTGKTTNLLAVPIFCLFFFALFVPRATARGVWLGAICGISAAVLVAFSGPLFGMNAQTGGDPISFQWVGPIALVVNITVGWCVSRCTFVALPGKENRC